MANRPVNRVCPECGGVEFKRRKSQKTIAFAPDRECKACQMVYTPPTPVWAAWVFILLGLPLVLVGVAAVVMLAVLVVPNPIAFAFWGGLAVLGVVTMRHGLRVLRNPEKV